MAKEKQTIEAYNADRQDNIGIDIDKQVLDLNDYLSPTPSPIDVQDAIGSEGQKGTMKFAQSTSNIKQNFEAGLSKEDQAKVELAQSQQQVAQQGDNLDAEALKKEAELEESKEGILFKTLDALSRPYFAMEGFLTGIFAYQDENFFEKDARPDYEVGTWRGFAEKAVNAPVAAAKRGVKGALMGLTGKEDDEGDRIINDAAFMHAVLKHDTDTSDWSTMTRLGMSIVPMVALGPLDPMMQAFSLLGRSEHTLDSVLRNSAASKAAIPNSLQKDEKFMSILKKDIKGSAEISNRYLEGINELSATYGVAPADVLKYNASGNLVSSKAMQKLTSAQFSKFRAEADQLVENAIGELANVRNHGMSLLNEAVGNRDWDTLWNFDAIQLIFKEAEALDNAPLEVINGMREFTRDGGYKNHMIDGDFAQVDKDHLMDLFTMAWESGINENQLNENGSLKLNFPHRVWNTVHTKIKTFISNGSEMRGIEFIKAMLDEAGGAHFLFDGTELNTVLPFLIQLNIVEPATLATLFSETNKALKESMIATQEGTEAVLKVVINTMAEKVMENTGAMLDIERELIKGSGSAEFFDRRIRQLIKEDVAEELQGMNQRKIKNLQKFEHEKAAFDAIEEVFNHFENSKVEITDIVDGEEKVISSKTGREKLEEAIKANKSNQGFRNDKKMEFLQPSIEHVANSRGQKVDEIIDRIIPQANSKELEEAERELDMIQPLIVDGLNETISSSIDIPEGMNIEVTPKMVEDSVVKAAGGDNTIGNVLLNASKLGQNDEAVLANINANLRDSILRPEYNRQAKIMEEQILAATGQAPTQDSIKLQKNIDNKKEKIATLERLRKEETYAIALEDWDESTEPWKVGLGNFANTIDLFLNDRDLVRELYDEAQGGFRIAEPGEASLESIINMSNDIVIRDPETNLLFMDGWADYGMEVAKTKYGKVLGTTKQVDGVSRDKLKEVFGTLTREDFKYLERQAQQGVNPLKELMERDVIYNSSKVAQKEFGRQAAPIVREKALLRNLEEKLAERENTLRQGQAKTQEEISKVPNFQAWKNSNKQLDESLGSAINSVLTGGLLNDISITDDTTGLDAFMGEPKIQAIIERVKDKVGGVELFRGEINEEGFNELMDIAPTHSGFTRTKLEDLIQKAGGIKENYITDDGIETFKYVWQPEVVSHMSLSKMVRNIDLIKEKIAAGTTSKYARGNRTGTRIISQDQSIPLETLENMIKGTLSSTSHQGNDFSLVNGLGRFTDDDILGFQGFTRVVKPSEFKLYQEFIRDYATEASKGADMTQVYDTYYRIGKDGEGEIKPSLDRFLSNEKYAKKYGSIAEKAKNQDFWIPVAKQTEAEVDATGKETGLFKPTEKDLYPKVMEMMTAVFKDIDGNDRIVPLMNDAQIDTIHNLPTDDIYKNAPTFLISKLFEDVDVRSFQEMVSTTSAEETLETRNDGFSVITKGDNSKSQNVIEERIKKLGFWDTKDNGTKNFPSMNPFYQVPYPEYIGASGASRNNVSMSVIAEYAQAIPVLNQYVKEVVDLTTSVSDSIAKAGKGEGQVDKILKEFHNTKVKPIQKKREQALKQISKLEKQYNELEDSLVNLQGLEGGTTNEQITNVFNQVFDLTNSEDANLQDNINRSVKRLIARFNPLNETPNANLLDINELSNKDFVKVIKDEFAKNDLSIDYNRDNAGVGIIDKTTTEGIKQQIAGLSSEENVDKVGELKDLSRDLRLEASNLRAQVEQLEAREAQYNSLTSEQVKAELDTQVEEGKDNVGQQVVAKILNNSNGKVDRIIKGILSDDQNVRKLIGRSLTNSEIDLATVYFEEVMLPKIAEMDSEGLNKLLSSEVAIAPRIEEKVAIENLQSGISQTAEQRAASGNKVPPIIQSSLDELEQAEIGGPVKYKLREELVARQQVLDRVMTEEIFKSESIQKIFSDVSEVLKYTLKKDLQNTPALAALNSEEVAAKVLNGESNETLQIMELLKANDFGFDGNSMRMDIGTLTSKGIADIERNVANSMLDIIDNNLTEWDKRVDEIVKLIPSQAKSYTDTHKRDISDLRTKVAESREWFSNLDNYDEKVSKSMDEIISQLDTNVYHISNGMENFAKNVLPGIIDKSGGSKDIRVWEADVQNLQHTISSMFIKHDKEFEPVKNFVTNLRSLRKSVYDLRIQGNGSSAANLVKGVKLKDGALVDDILDTVQHTMFLNSMREFANSVVYNGVKIFNTNASKNALIESLYPNHSTHNVWTGLEVAHGGAEAEVKEVQAIKDWKELSEQTRQLNEKYIDGELASEDKESIVKHTLDRFNKRASKKDYIWTTHGESAKSSIKSAQDVVELEVSQLVDKYAEERNINKKDVSKLLDNIFVALEDIDSTVMAADVDTILQSTPDMKTGRAGANLKPKNGFKALSVGELKDEVVKTVGVGSEVETTPITIADVVKRSIDERLAHQESIEAFYENIIADINSGDLKSNPKYYSTIDTSMSMNDREKGNWDKHKSKLKDINEDRKVARNEKDAAAAEDLTEQAIEEINKGRKYALSYKTRVRMIEAQKKLEKLAVDGESIQKLTDKARKEMKKEIDLFRPSKELTEDAAKLLRQLSPLDKAKAEANWAKIQSFIVANNDKMLNFFKDRKYIGGDRYHAQLADWSRSWGRMVEENLVTYSLDGNIILDDKILKEAGFTTPQEEREFIKEQIKQIETDTLNQYQDNHGIIVPKDLIYDNGFGEHGFTQGQIGSMLIDHMNTQFYESIRDSRANAKVVEGRQNQKLLKDIKDKEKAIFEDIDIEGLYELSKEYKLNYALFDGSEFEKGLPVPGNWGRVKDKEFLHSKDMNTHKAQAIVKSFVAQAQDLGFIKSDLQAKVIADALNSKSKGTTQIVGEHLISTLVGTVTKGHKKTINKAKIKLKDIENPLLRQFFKNEADSLLEILPDVSLDYSGISEVSKKDVDVVNRIRLETILEPDETNTVFDEKTKKIRYKAFKGNVKSKRVNMFDAALHQASEEVNKYMEGYPSAIRKFVPEGEDLATINHEGFKQVVHDFVESLIDEQTMSSIGSDFEKLIAKYTPDASKKAEKLIEKHKDMFGEGASEVGKGLDLIKRKDKLVKEIAEVYALNDIIMNYIHEGNLEELLLNPDFEGKYKSRIKQILSTRTKNGGKTVVQELRTLEKQNRNIQAQIAQNNELINHIFNGDITKNSNQRMDYIQAEINSWERNKKYLFDKKVKQEAQLNKIKKFNSELNAEERWVLFREGMLDTVENFKNTQKELQSLSYHYDRHARIIKDIERVENNVAKDHSANLAESAISQFIMSPDGEKVSQLSYLGKDMIDIINRIQKNNVRPSVLIDGPYNTTALKIREDLVAVIEKEFPELYTDNKRTMHDRVDALITFFNESNHKDIKTGEVSRIEGATQNAISRRKSNGNRVRTRLEKIENIRLNPDAVKPEDRHILDNIVNAHELLSRAIKAGNSYNKGELIYGFKPSELKAKKAGHKGAMTSIRQRVYEIVGTKNLDLQGIPMDFKAQNREKLMNVKKLRKNNFQLKQQLDNINVDTRRQLDEAEKKIKELNDQLEQAKNASNADNKKWEKNRYGVDIQKAHSKMSEKMNKALEELYVKKYGEDWKKVINKDDKKILTINENIKDIMNTEVMKSAMHSPELLGYVASRLDTNVGRLLLENNDVFAKLFSVKHENYSRELGGLLKDFGSHKLGSIVKMRTSKSSGYNKDIHGRLNKHLKDVKAGKSDAAELGNMSGSIVNAIPNVNNRALEALQSAFQFGTTSQVPEQMNQDWGEYISEIKTTMNDVRSRVMDFATEKAFTNEEERQRAINLINASHQQTNSYMMDEGRQYVNANANSRRAMEGARQELYDRRGIPLKYRIEESVEDLQVGKGFNYEEDKSRTGSAVGASGRGRTFFGGTTEDFNKAHGYSQLGINNEESNLAIQLFQSDPFIPTAKLLQNISKSGESATVMQALLINGGVQVAGTVPESALHQYKEVDLRKFMGKVSEFFRGDILGQYMFKDIPGDTISEMADELAKEAASKGEQIFDSADDATHAVERMVKNLFVEAGLIEEGAKLPSQGSVLIPNFVHNVWFKGEKVIPELMENVAGFVDEFTRFFKPMMLASGGFHVKNAMGNSFMALVSNPQAAKYINMAGSYMHGAMDKLHNEMPSIRRAFANSENLNGIFYTTIDNVVLNTNNPIDNYWAMVDFLTRNKDKYKFISTPKIQIGKEGVAEARALDVVDIFRLWGKERHKLNVKTTAEISNIYADRTIALNSPTRLSEIHSGVPDVMEVLKNDPEAAKYLYGMNITDERSLVEQAIKNNPITQIMPSNIAKLGHSLALEDFEQLAFAAWKEVKNNPNIVTQAELESAVWKKVYKHRNGKTKVKGITEKMIDMEREIMNLSEAERVSANETITSMLKREFQHGSRHSFAKEVVFDASSTRNEFNSIMQRIFPFWNFMKQSFDIQVRNIKNLNFTPYYFLHRSLAQIMNSQGIQANEISEWTKSEQYIPIKLENGDILSFKWGNPTNSIGKYMMSPFSGETNMLQELGTGMNPILKFFMSEASGRVDTYFGGEYDNIMDEATSIFTPSGLRNIKKSIQYDRENKGLKEVEDDAVFSPDHQRATLAVMFPGIFKVESSEANKIDAIDSASSVYHSALNKLAKDQGYIKKRQDYIPEIPQYSPISWDVFNTPYQPFGDAGYPEWLVGSPKKSRLPGVYMGDNDEIYY